MTNNSKKIRDPFDLSLKDVDGEEPGELKGGDYDIDENPMKYATQERVDDDEEDLQSNDEHDEEMDGMNIVNETGEEESQEE